MIDMHARLHMQDCLQWLLLLQQRVVLLLLRLQV
jgi:hypothetical protein